MSDKINTKPNFSLIIPVLTEEKILDRVLSVYKRELLDKYRVQLIVSDGGSKDGTLEIARRYADIVVEHTENRRQTIAEGRNKGAEAAEGEIFVFINGDTIPEDPGKMFAFLEEWRTGNNIYADSCALACYVSAFPEEILLRDKVFYLLHNAYVKFLNNVGLGMCRGECQIVRADAFRKAGGYNSKIVAGEDYDLYRRLAQIGRIRFAGQVRVLESPRRFRKYGYARILWQWTMNSLSVSFYNRSSSDEWEAVR